MKSAEIEVSYDFLKAYAANFPSQGGVEIGPYLEKYASEVPNGSAIIELGSWLGGGTAYLALGAMKSGAPMHVYDRFFCASEEERQKAAKFGVSLQIGQDTMPRVMRDLEKFPVDIHYHKGSVKASTFSWLTVPVLPIGLYVDDLTKTDPIWRPVINACQSYFIPEKTILVLMDYYFYETAGENYRAQQIWMEQHRQRFELIEDRVAGTTTAVFKYLR